MPAETLAEQASEMIWMDYDNRRSSKGFIYNDGTVDPGVTFTEFMKEAHEVALQLLSEFPEINLAEGEYLDEDDDDTCEENQIFPCSDQIRVLMTKTRWNAIYKRTDGSFVLNRPYDPEANDLIVARDFPNPYAVLFFLGDEAKAAAEFQAGIDAGYQSVANQVRLDNQRKQWEANHEQIGNFEYPGRHQLWKFNLYRSKLSTQYILTDENQQAEVATWKEGEPTDTINTMIREYVVEQEMHIDDEHDRHMIN